MYGGTGAVLALDEQRVRLYCCVWVIEFDAVINWRWTQYEALMRHVREGGYQLVVLHKNVVLLWGGRTFIPMWCPKYTAMTINCDSACINLRSWNVWNGCRVGNGWTARTFVSLCMSLNELEVVAMSMMTLRWSSFVECIEWLSCWPWTYSAYVCIAACAITFESVISLQCSMHGVVISPSSCAVQTHNNDNGGSLSIFVR